MFDDAFADATAIATRDRISRPLLVPDRGPGLFSNFWGAVRDAAVSAPLESVRALTTVAEAYGKAAEPQTRGMVDLLGQTHKDVETRSIEQDVYEPIKRGIKRFTPDPATTGTASQIVFGAGKVLGKAVGYGAVGGFPGAVLGTGVDEGISESLRLTDQGVDPGTAAKVGAVHGAATAAGLAAPIAGKTLLQTAGIVLGTGPGLFVGENLAARTILNAANYSEISKQYDPYDVVGLIASTVPGAAIGTAAHAIRGARAKGKAPVIVPDVEEVAAAHQVIAADQVNGSALVKPHDAAGLNAHVDAVESAGRALDAGEPVSVTDTVRADPELVRHAAQRAEERLTPDVINAARAAEQELNRDRGTPHVTEPDPVRSIATDETAPRLVPTGEIDDAGMPIMRSVDEIAMEADIQVRDTVAFKAAISCFLGAA